MERDPRFPDRPAHQDFEAIASIVRGQDDEADSGQSRVVFDRTADLASLSYMAKQRALRVVMRADLTDHPQVALIVALVGSAWLDAFCAGTAYGRQHPEKS
jgi:hypothetical protein